MMLALVCLILVAHLEASHQTLNKKQKLSLLLLGLIPIRLSKFFRNLKLTNIPLGDSAFIQKHQIIAKT
jgi:hypothetical protein